MTPGGARPKGQQDKQVNLARRIYHIFKLSGQLKEIRRLAPEKDKNINELVREILREYLKNK